MEKALPLLFFILTLLTHGLSSAADFSCIEALKTTSDIRKEIVDIGIQNGLPFFEVKLQGAFVPVVLLNKKTLSFWEPAFRKTVGVAQALHPENEADHGYVRLPGHVQTGESVLVDLFSPVKAGPNALNGTGYRFKELKSYFEKRTGSSNVYVDLAYWLNTNDRNRVWLYQLAKRIALVRLQYAFDTPNNAWVTSQRRMLQQDGECRNSITGGFEQCNNSRLAHNGAVHANEMRGRMKQLFNKDINHIYSLTETKRFLDEAKKDLLYRQWRSAQEMDPQFLAKENYLALLNPHFRRDLSREQKVDAISYLLATNIIEEVVAIRNRLGIVEGRESQYGNPNIAAIFIYADDEDSVRRFYEGRVRYFGARSGNGFDTDYFEVRSPYRTSWPVHWTQYRP